MCHTRTSCSPEFSPEVAVLVRPLPSIAQVEFIIQPSSSDNCGNIHGFPFVSFGEGIGGESQAERADVLKKFDPEATHCGSLSLDVMCTARWLRCYDELKVLLALPRPFEELKLLRSISLLGDKEDALKKSSEKAGEFVGECSDMRHFSGSSRGSTMFWSAPTLRNEESIFRTASVEPRGERHVSTNVCRCGPTKS